MAVEWLQRAENDLQYAEAGERETGRHHITCFLCHQSVEKVLKGTGLALGKTLRKTHSLRQLLSELLPHFPTLKTQQERIERLDAAYIPSRYPGPVAEEFRKEDAEEALQTAREFVDFLMKLF